jgi:hypothetical protein
MDESLSPKQVRIFLSSAPEDDAVALAAALRDSGADVWLDEGDGEKETLRADTALELREHPAFLALLSPATLASELAIRQLGPSCQLEESFSD